MTLRFLVSGLSIALVAIATATQAADLPQLVYASDAHFGIKRTFRGAKDVEGQAVNHALVESLNALPAKTLPADGGLSAGAPVGAIDLFVETGDIANRQEPGSPAAAVSWSQFAREYIQGLKTLDHAGAATTILLTPGNHDVSNAIGWVKPMDPAVDATSLVAIYNHAMRPAVPKTPETFNYATDKVNYSRDFAGTHLVFINMWPDSLNRAWLESDLKAVNDNTPVLLFTHDQPNLDTKHLRNPNGDHGLNGTDKFENMVVDEAVDPDKNGKLTVDGPSTTRQRELANFLAQHKNIVAYFHGHDNANEFYTWKGPDENIALNVFRVDSAMKGNVSSKDETKLSYQLVTLDPAQGKMTVREVLWNAPEAWGASTTVSLARRER